MHEPPEIDQILREVEELDHESAASQDEVEVVARIAEKFGAAHWFSRLSSDQGNSYADVFAALPLLRGTTYRTDQSRIGGEGAASESDSIETQLQQLRQGSSVAMQYVWDRFFQQLVGLAASEVSAAVVIDPEDVASDALGELWQLATSGQMSEVTDWDGVWRWLVEIVRRDLRSHIQKQYHSLLIRLEIPQQRTIAALLLEGRTTREIAELTRLSVPTVERRRRLIREVLGVDIDDLRVNRTSFSVKNILPEVD